MKVCKRKQQSSIERKLYYLFRNGDSCTPYALCGTQSPGRAGDFDAQFIVKEYQKLCIRQRIIVIMFYYGSDRSIYKRVLPLLLKAHERLMQQA